MQQRTIRPLTRRMLAVAFAAAWGVTLFPAQPVQAGMGTGNPPPPPPPPRDVESRVFEASEDVNLQGRGYPDITVFHARSSFDGSTSTVTRSNGTFKYTIRQGDTISHRARLFGVMSNFTSGDIVISSNARLEIKVADDEEDFTSIGDAAKGIVTRWKMGVRVLRGVQGDETATPTEVTLSPPDMRTRSFGTQFVPRHMRATPTGTNARQPKVTYQVVSLVGSDNAGNPRLRWMDDPVKGQIDLLPGQSTTLTLRKILAVAEK